MKSAGGDKENMVGFKHPVAGADRAALNERQQIALHALAGHVGAHGFGASGYFVQLVEEHDTVLLRGLERTLFNLVFVDEFGRFLFTQGGEGGLDRHAPGFGLTFGEIRKHVLQLIGHLFHARGRGDLHTGARADFQVDLFVIEFALAQFFAQELARAVPLVFSAVAGCGQQHIENALFGGFLGAKTDFFYGLFTPHFYGHLYQIADNGLHIAPHIAHFRKLRRLDLDERRVGQACQAPGNLCFTDARRADHQDIFGRDLGAQRLLHLHAAPAVAQGIGYRAFGVLLADHVLVQFVDDFSGRHIGHGLQVS